MEYEASSGLKGTKIMEKKKKKSLTVKSVENKIAHIL
jgi:hypothetical protein